MKRMVLGGFSLVELLVVIVIIGLLAALLWPSLGNVFETSKLSKCTQRLYYIGQAYHVRASEARVMEDLGPLRVVRWKSQLVPYLENKTEQLLCPVASNPAGIPTGWTDVDPWARAREAVENGEVPESSMFWTEGDLTEVRSTESLKVEVWLRPGSSFRGVAANECIYIMDCTEGQWAMKKNVTDTSYELWFEDSWNTTWNDLVVRFTEKDTGELELTYLEEHTGGNCYNLVDVTTGECILRGMGDGNTFHHWPRLPLGTTVTLEPENKQERLVADDENSLFSPDPGGSTSVTGVATRGTYGMNSLADFRENVPGHVILCMDYEKTVARGPTDSLPDWWHQAGWQTTEGLPVFARHFGRVNVLFSDGRVELMDPYLIDPSGPVSVNKYWDPAAK